MPFLTTLAATVMLAASMPARADATVVVSKDGLPLASPSTVGMSAVRLAAIDRVVQRGIDAGGFPGASVVVGRRGYAVMQRGYGALGWGATAPAVTPDRTIYDLASLTKVVGTTTAAMILWDRGRLPLDAPVSRWLPEFTGGGREHVTVRHLLTHRSGLPAGRDLWRLASSPAEARRLVLETRLGCAPGRCFEYSDLGADVLGFVVEAAAQQPLDLFLRDNVFRPLGMEDTGFRPAAALRDRIAPTEVAPPRGYPLRGEVHDENAYALGGVAGHAGLFSTASDLAIFAQMMLNGGAYRGVRIASDSAVRLFSRRTAGTRALGWDTCAGEKGCGAYLSERAFGHLGYTGTSLWIDPEREMFVVLLTNRVHAARATRPATVIMDVRADLSDAAALAVTDFGPGELAMPAAFRADRAAGWNKPLRAKSARGKRSARRSRSAVTRTAKKKASAAASARKAGGAEVSRAKSAKSAKSSKSVKSASARSAKKGSAKRSVER